MISKIFLKNKIRARDEILKDLTRGKIVAHFGCIDDDLNLINEKLKQKRYLHEIVSDSAKECFGIDINRKLLKKLRQLGFENIFFGDIQYPNGYEIDPKILKKVETVLIPDTIEHLPNPGMAILGLKTTFRRGTKILISTPNPFMWAHFFTTIFRREIFSPHHLCSYSIKNMENLLKINNIVIQDIYPYWYSKEGNFGKKIADILLSKFFTRISPLFCDGFVYECVIN
ncbi:MAG: class I SAM-dependent methyltransferase [Patescibacteria group bacterium]|nr:class I SAM-dependent methyltransferase [Patescibacteria group bacterium]